MKSSLIKVLSFFHSLARAISKQQIPRFFRSKENILAWYISSVLTGDYSVHVRKPVRCCWLGCTETVYPDILIIHKDNTLAGIAYLRAVPQKGADSDGLTDVDLKNPILEAPELACIDYCSIKSRIKRLEQAEPIHSFEFRISDNDQIKQESYTADGLVIFTLNKNRIKKLSGFLKSGKPPSKNIESKKNILDFPITYMRNVFNSDLPVIKKNELKMLGNITGKLNDHLRHTLPKADLIQHSEVLNRIERFNDNRFNLLVVGEVSSGKSTFINAIMKSEILHSAVLQSTNNIIDIYNSKTKFLRITYGDGRIEQVVDDPKTEHIDEALLMLEEIGNINNDYRDIPTTIVDEMIISQKYKIIANSEMINELERRTQLKLGKKQKIIQNYVDEHPRSKIVVNAEYACPFPWRTNRVHLIDTPGINARGGVQERTFRILPEADAVIFVHPIKPIESISLNKMIEHMRSGKSNIPFLLILTHTSNYTRQEIGNLRREAIRIYSDELSLPPSNILPFDSLLALLCTDSLFSKQRSLHELHPTTKDCIPRDCRCAEDVFLRSNCNEVRTMIMRLVYSSHTKQLNSIVSYINDNIDIAITDTDDYRYLNNYLNNSHRIAGNQ